MKTKFNACVLAVVLLAAVVVCFQALALSGEDKVVARGQTAKALPGWPQGVLEFINDPLRVNGWHPWFSECPNDGYYYSMEVRQPQDVNHLIKLLAAIKANKVELNLDPANGARHADGVGAIFALGNQAIMDRWFKTLPEIEPGIRQFGVHRYREPPAAQPPTLTIYVGHKAVDLKKLRIPVNIEVTAPTAKSYREEHAEAIKAIDEFIASHKAEQEASPKRRTEIFDTNRQQKN
jgi:hypothetical protein